MGQHGPHANTSWLPRVMSRVSAPLLPCSVGAATTTPCGTERIGLLAGAFGDHQRHSWPGAPATRSVANVGSREGPGTVGECQREWMGLEQSAPLGFSLWVGAQPSRLGDFGPGLPTERPAPPCRSWHCTGKGSQLREASPSCGQATLTGPTRLPLAGDQCEASRAGTRHMARGAGHRGPSWSNTGR